MVSKRAFSWPRILFLVGTIALAADAQEQFPVAYTSKGNAGGRSLRDGAYSRWRRLAALHLHLGEGETWCALDLGLETRIDRLRWGKHFWPFRTPTDLDVAVCSDDHDRDGNGTWTTVAEVRGNTHMIGSVVRFPPVTARYVRVTVGGCYGKPGRWNLADINQIEVGLARETQVTGLSVSPKPGRNVLRWRDPRPGGAADAGPRMDEGGDTISWRPVPRDGHFTVYRSTNLNDGYRVLTLAGPVTKTHPV